ncbi:MAG: hypothetical protein QOF78_337 [Phycisphaerales bacterium]|jgi:hypothetical protein|nr:hypothetical protein [Phycisphaerales bacterium]
MMSHLRFSVGLAIFCSAAAFIVAGCSGKPKVDKKKQIPSRYTALPQKKVPDVFKDTVYEKCDLVNTEPFLVSGYGFVSNLNGTGDSAAPNAVREYMVKEMIKHKWDSSLSGIRTPTPEEALRDPRNAIVQVDGYLPPGVRKGQRFDIQVSAIPDNATTSLAQGDLFQTELRIMGANPHDPGGSVNVFARAEGPVFVNPAYALKTDLENDPGARRSLRMGLIMNGARSLEDRPLGLRLRQPSMRMSRYIEQRIDQRLQEIRPDVIAAAQDEGIVHLYVPAGLNGDWEHFAGLVNFVYLNNSPEFAAAKARQLADEAIKPKAPLLEISYAWEGLGKAALPVIRERELMSHANADVAFAAARAAAYLGDTSAPKALINMARQEGHKFQVNAVQVLGTLQSSPSINEMLRPLLDSKETLVRLEAYKMLARNGDSYVFAMPIAGGPGRGGFTLDVVRSDGPPIIYATQRGEPRVAVIGNRISLNRPITYSTLGGRLTISSDEGASTVTIFYRPTMPIGGARTRAQAEKIQPIAARSNADIVEVIARLGGEGFQGVPSSRALDFNYGEILSILSSLTEKRQITAYAGGEHKPASFILQELPRVQDEILDAPPIPEQGRPQKDEDPKVGLAK